MLRQHTVSTIDRLGVLDVCLKNRNTCGSGTLHRTMKNGGCHVPCEALLLRSSARKLLQMPSFKRPDVGPPQPSFEDRQLKSGCRSALSCSANRPAATLYVTNDALDGVPTVGSTDRWQSHTPSVQTATPGQVRTSELMLQKRVHG